MRRHVQDPRVVGGETVFEGTCLSVFHIGKRFHRERSARSILEDYCYLDWNDIQAAHQFFLDHSTRV